MDYFEVLKQKIPALEKIPSDRGEISYFAQEVLRFHSIAGSLRESDLLDNTSAVDRQISHILGRSLLEGFFWLVYIFDETSGRAARFEERINDFKIEYYRYWNDQNINDKTSLEAADPSWKEKHFKKNMRDILDKITNDHRQKLSYLYFIYRVASFDTHGNSMDVLFQSTFGKPCKFSVLDFKYGFDLMANHYLVIMKRLSDAKDI